MSRVKMRTFWFFRSEALRRSSPDSAADDLALLRQWFGSSAAVGSFPAAGAWSASAAKRTLEPAPAEAAMAGRQRSHVEEYAKTTPGTHAGGVVLDYCCKTLSNNGLRKMMLKSVA